MGGGGRLAMSQGYPDRTRSPPEAIGILAYNRQCSGAALPDGDPKVIQLLSEGFLAGVKGVS